MLRGSAWMIALRWSLRLMGVASTFVLAHLLKPADFGVVAMAMLFVGLVEALGDTGERLALLRLADPGRDHYDTAWTLQLAVGLAVAAAIFLLAPLAGHYFHDSRSVLAMRCLSARALLGGLENIGSIDFRRDLRFGTLFQLNVRAKVASMVLTLALAALLRNYWALIAGIIAGQAAVTCLSYIMHPYRPRLCWRAGKELFGFSAWTLLRTAALYLATQVDQFAVGGFADAGAMGRYAVAADVAASPTAEINEPMVAVLYPVMSRQIGEPARLRRLYLQVLAWSATICAATGMGVALVATDYAAVVLGRNWQGLEPLIRLLALAAAFTGLSSGADTTFDALGMPQRSARLHWLRLGLLAAATLAAGFWLRSLVAVAVARLAVGLVFLPLLLAAVGGAANVTGRAMLGALWRPVVAAMAMALVVVTAEQALPWPGFGRLLLTIACGAIVYGCALFALWHWAGRPPGPEADCLALAQTARRKIGGGENQAQPDDGATLQDSVAEFGDPL